MWLITNKKSAVSGFTKNSVNVGNYDFHLMDESGVKVFQFTSPENILIFFTGNPTSRQSGKLINCEQTNQNRFLRASGSVEFAQDLKGNFVMGIIRENDCCIISDRFAIEKYFYSSSPDFVASDNLKALKQFTKTSVSVNGMAKFALGYHFVGGTTVYEQIYHNQPAEILNYTNGEFKKTNYWHSKELFTENNKNVEIPDISSKLKEVVLSNLNIVNSEKISLSLTGGADTRNLLAIFLSMNIRPNLYTYGNPKSADCAKASIIARELGLKHTIHDINMTAETFASVSKKIIKESSGLTSIHRAHRLMAVESESIENDTMFLGTLGGEFIKGVSEDDYIIPSFVFDNWNEQNLTTEVIGGYLSAKGINVSRLHLDELRDFFSSEPYFIGSIADRKLSALSHITAHLHDAQDVVMYETVMKSVFTPFLDIDYLELVFSSDFTFEKKEEHSSKWRRRIENPIYGSKFLKTIYPPLMQFEYSGEHRPDEVLKNKYFAAVTKTLRKKRRGDYPPNFPLGNWMRDFVITELPKCKDHLMLNKLFCIDQMLAEVKSGPNGNNEGYWLKYTNPIMMRYIIEEFGG